MDLSNITVCMYICTGVIHSESVVALPWSDTDLMVSNKTGLGIYEIFTAVMCDLPSCFAVSHKTVLRLDVQGFLYLKGGKHRDISHEVDFPPWSF